MAANFPKSTFRRQFWQSIIATEATIQNRSSIDSDAWLESADRHFQQANSTMTQALEAEAIHLSKKILLNEYLRHGRSPAVEQVRELERIAKRAARANRYESIEVAPGQFLRKRELDCTVEERLALAEQYEKRAESDLRRARYHRFTAAQLVLEGMAHDESLQDWIDRQAASG